MKKIILIIPMAVIVFLSINARAQVINNAYETVTSPMDNVEESHAAMYADVQGAGDSENAKPQHVLYNEMTVPGDIANERHINPADGHKTIVEQRVLNTYE